MTAREPTYKPPTREEIDAAWPFPTAREPSTASPEPSVLDCLKAAIDGFEEHVQFVKGSLMDITVKQWKRVAQSTPAQPSTAGPWARIPVEPTPAMEQFICNCDIRSGAKRGTSPEWKDCYRALLKEAQSTPAQPSTEGASPDAIYQAGYDEGFMNGRLDESRPLAEDARNAVEWRESLADVMREMPSRTWRNDGNAPGHAHGIAGIWDSDNGALAGKPCAWCLAWSAARSALAAMSPEPK